MNKLLVATCVACAMASVAEAGFWDVVNKIDRGIDTTKKIANLVEAVTTDEPTQTTARVTQQARTTVENKASAVTVKSVPSSTPVKTAVAAVSAPTAAELAAFAGQRTTASETAVPEFSYGTLYVKKPATPEQVAEAKNACLAAKKKLEGVQIRFENVDDATVACVLATFYGARTVNLDKSAAVTTLAPFALVRGLEKLYLNKIPCSDLSPLAGLVKLKEISFRYCTVGDLSPLSSLAALEDIDFYGATLASGFSPLAACPKLAKIDYYATKLEPALYDSLGDLKQVRKFQGGLSKMTSLAWLRRVPQAEEVQIFAEKLTDFEAFSTLPNLKKVRIWNMEGDNMSTAFGDLKVLSACKNLEIVELPGSVVSNLEVLGTLPKLREVSLTCARVSMDLGFLASTPNVVKLDISRPNDGVTLTGFENVYKLANLETLDMRGVPGVTSIAGLTACTKLKGLTASKDVFPKEETDALEKLIKGNNRYGRVSLY